ncbi:MAG: hypothetical protein NTW25_02825, partial [Candidatus Kapabacteria bacterium]|nr:hypothetical protein [Candidatus Kapabacteria bacterium]
FFQLNIYEFLLPKIFNDVYNININLKNSTLRLYDEKINIDIDKRNPNKENSYVLAQGAIDSVKNQNISINPKKIDKVQDFQSIKTLKINQSVCAYCNFQTFCRLKEIE